MHVFITGGTGFIGRHLPHYFLDQGHSLTLVGSRTAPDFVMIPRCRYLRADTTQPGEWQQSVGQADLVINLAGRSIFRRWSARYKQAIYDSRVLTTRNITDALAGESRAVLVSTSAVGYYGDSGEAQLGEDAVNGSDFLAALARDWEAEAVRATKKGTRVAIARFGIVLGANGGALASMLPAFRLFAGGPIGSGRQWFPWIHIADLVGAIVFLSDHRNLEGPFNLCSPEPVRNKQFAQTLGRILGRPAILPAPALLLKLLLGEMAGVLLSGQRAVPAKLLAAGYDFRYPHLEAALMDLLKQ